MINLSEILKPGMSAEVKKIVDVEDTVGNSSPYLNQYLSTSACVALMVQAAMAATEGVLPEGYISVGRRIELEHEIPSMLDTAIVVKATLREIRGNRLLFDVVGTDALGAVFRGVNERAVVNRFGLAEKGAERATQLQELRRQL